MAILFTHLSGAHRGRVDRFSQSTDKVVFGRAVECEVRLSPADTVVSSRHAQALKTERGFTIEDIGSRNGTLINGQMIERAPLSAGDHIQFGPGGPELRFEVVSESVRAEAEDDFAILEAILEAGDVVNKYINTYLNEFGLTATKFNTLQVLSDDPRGGVTQNQLGSKLTVTSPNITGVIDRLERDHLVTRETHPSDRRANLVRLTDEGQKMFEQAADLHALRTQQLVSTLNREERDTLARLLQKVADAVKKNL
jgi:MarR family 2-MHQ and catechol resistance regulon transcriptional repressor